MGRLRRFFRAAAAIAAGEAVYGTPVGNSYKSDVMDRFVEPSGKSYKPRDLIRFLLEAENGDTRRIYSFMDEMVARDPHIKTEHAKSRDQLSFARLQLLPYPADYQTRTARKSQPNALPLKIYRYCEQQLKDPCVRLDLAIAAWADGDFKGLGAVEQAWEPAAATGEFVGLERLTALTPVPSQRFLYDPQSTALWFQYSGMFSDTRPVDAYGGDDYGNAFAIHMPEESVPSPARRGVLRSLFGTFLALTYGPDWWSRDLEKHGSPMRVGYYPDGDENAKLTIAAALQRIGADAWAALPEGSKIEFVNQVARTSGQFPTHQMFIEFNQSQVSKAFNSSTQTTQVLRGAGSVASTEVHSDEKTATASARAFRIAQTIREKVLRPAVARNFGIENANLYTPDVRLEVGERPSIKTVDDATGIRSLIGDTTPADYFHELFGVPQIEEGEDPIGSVAPVPDNLVGLPGNNSEPQGRPAGKQKPGAPAAAAAANQDPSRERPEPHRAEVSPSSLVRGGAGRGSGEDIVAPVRDIIDRALIENQPLYAVLAQVRLRAQARPILPKDMEVEDLLAAVLAEAAFRGLADERKQA